MEVAAPCTSCKVVSVLDMLAGLMSSAIRSGLGHNVMQKPKALGCHLAVKKIYTGRVAAGPGEARDKTKPDRVFADAENDRDRRCGRFSCERSKRVSGRGDDSHTALDQVGHHSWQPILLTFQPVVLDRHVLAFNVTGFVEAFAECAPT